MATFRSDLRVDPPLKELRAALKELDASLPKQLNKVTKAGAEIVASDARSRASGVSPLAARSAGQIKSSGTAAGALVTLSATKSKPEALAAFLGMTRRTGWFAAKKYGGAVGSGGQHLPWIGTGWTVGGTGGPRAINPAFAAKQDEFEKALMVGLNEFGAKHFPTGD